MPEPLPNPHVNENNAREEGRQEGKRLTASEIKDLMSKLPPPIKRCTHGCTPGLIHPTCEKHGFTKAVANKLADWNNPIFDGPLPPPVCRDIYLAGPMRGYAEFNFPAFTAACKDLRNKGLTVASPHEMDLAIGFNPVKDTPDEAFLIAAVLRDVEAIIKADALVLLPGWSHSTGARAEFAIAKWLQKTVLVYPDMAPI